MCICGQCWWQCTHGAVILMVLDIVCTVGCGWAGGKTISKMKEEEKKRKDIPAGWRSSSSDIGRQTGWQWLSWESKMESWCNLTTPNFCEVSWHVTTQTLTHSHHSNASITTSMSRPVLPNWELTKGGSAITSGCQQRARVMKLRYVAWWWRSRERKPTGFGNGFGRCLASASTSRRGSE